jgi:hypothetical protein
MTTRHLIVVGVDGSDGGRRALDLRLEPARVLQTTAPRPPIRAGRSNWPVGSAATGRPAPVYPPPPCPAIHAC